MSFKKEKTLQFLFENRDRVVLALGLAALVAGIVKVFAPPLNPGPEAEIIPASSPLPNKKADGQQIIVDLAGAVVKPGVYYLPPGSRVKDLLVAGGGLSRAANRDWIAKNLNLAQPLTDGGKIYIPSRGDTLGQTSPPSASNNQLGKINLNLATGQQLETLPGVGPATAKRIIEYRQSSGGFKSIEEIQSVAGIGPKLFEQIKGKIATE